MIKINYSLYKIFYSLFFISAILSVTSCGNAVSETRTDTVYMHLSSEPGNLNPIISTDAYESMINKNIYESLIERDIDTLELKPLLAQRWEISPDKLTYRFYLKKGILFSDGVEMTADDVIYSYNTIKDPKVASASLKVYFMDIVSATKLDKYTVEFKYNKLFYQALEICGTITVIPKHIFNDGTDFNTHKNNRFPVGTGPYKLEKWETGKRVTLTVNDKNRDKPPVIKKIVYSIISEVNVALQMLKKGELDVMSVRPIQWVRQTNSEKFLKHNYKLTYYLPYFNYIGWNARRDFFSDKRVRLAMTHFINREAILDKLLFGLGKEVTGSFYIFSKAYNDKIKPWPYDPARGRALLAEAGWKDTDGDGILDKNGKKFRFTFTIASTNKFAERLATILKEDLSKNGIEMDINRYEWAVFVDKLHKRDFDAVTVGWSLGYSGDPYQLWHSSQTENGSNFCYFKNAEADDIIIKSRMEFDEDKRNIMYRRFHEILHDEQPYTFLFCTPALSVVSRRFENVKVHIMGLDYREWTINEKISD